MLCSRSNPDVKMPTNTHLRLRLEKSVYRNMTLRSAHVTRAAILINEIFFIQNMTQRYSVLK